MIPMRDLVSHSIGGGWGEELRADGREQVAIIRGADFPRVAVGDTSGVPRRWESARKLPQRTLQPGDIVLEGSGGTSDRPTGRTVFISEQLLDRFDVPVIPASFCRLVRIDPALADPHYVYWWLQGMYADGRTWGYQNRSTGIANFQFQHFLDTEMVRLPSLDEQRAIAATLGALDDKIESNRRTISLIDELVRTRFEANFDLTQVSDGVSIAELVTVNRRLKLPRGTVSTYIGMSSLPEFSPSVLDWEKREFGSGQKFMNGDVLMARITPCLENGKTAVVDMLEEGEVGWGSTEYVVLSPKESISTPWIYALVRHPDLREWAVRRMSGTSGRQRFQADGFATYRISEPTSTQLDGFNNFALPLFKRIAQLRDEMKKLTRVRDALLPEVLSGRIRVPFEGVEA